jgi:endonuclease III related protein
MRHRQIQRTYEVLFKAWGPQDWWPGDTPFEIIVGAILTQNAAWTNVEKAIANLKRARVLSLAALHRLPRARLAQLIRPAGYFNVKAHRLRSFTSMVHDRFSGNLKRLFALETRELREVLLGVNGIGPETADSILLYAANRRIFVIDAYTRRFMTRHGWISPKADYDELARAFTGAVPRDTQLYNEYHALIVNLGKSFCRPRPRCKECPLRLLLPAGGPKL